VFVTQTRCKSTAFFANKKILEKKNANCPKIFICEDFSYFRTYVGLPTIVPLYPLPYPYLRTPYPTPPYVIPPTYSPLVIPLYGGGLLAAIIFPEIFDFLHGGTPFSQKVGFSKNFFQEKFQYFQKGLICKKKRYEINHTSRY
jgi:hypothetical protein